MIQPPEALRLYELGDEAHPPPSPVAPPAPSHPGTVPPLSPFETRRRTSRSETRSTDRSALDRASTAAADADAARHALDEAIADARAAGASWRAIGAITGLPYQTLHRHHARGRR